MVLWIALLISLILAAMFHWMAAHRNQKDIRQLRAYYWGDPLLQAWALDFISLLLLLLIVLRARGIDIPALWDQ